MVWVLQYDCGDFYCDGDHVLGVFSSLEKAEDAKAVHESSRKPGQWWEHSIAAWNLDTLEVDTPPHVYT